METSPLDITQREFARKMRGYDPEEVRTFQEQIAEEKADKVHRYERTYGAFERSFTLPATVNAEAIKATYEHGLLTLVLPKIEKAKARQITVDITQPKAVKG